MGTQDLTQMTLLQAAELLRTRTISSHELTMAHLEKIQSQDSQIGAYLYVASETALAAAKRADILLCKKSQEPHSPLLGVCMAVKDNLCTRGMPTTCASKMLEHFIPPYDASVIEKLNDHGAVLLGKLNMDEFAMGSTTENSAFQRTQNPAAPGRVPGGSSGGSAAAVAAGEAVYTLGSDTGGSIRLPASFCGVVGMKPTYGRVSRYGLIAFASSLDQIGPISKNVSDNAWILDTICGKDGLDATCADREEASFAQGIENGIKGWKIGIAREFFTQTWDPTVQKVFSETLERCSRLGAEVVEISLPSLPLSLSAYYMLSSAQASSNLARYDGVRYGKRVQTGTSVEEFYQKTRQEGFGDEVKRRILAGTFVLSAGYYETYYQKAQQIQAMLRREYQLAFSQCDVLLSPAAATVAYEFDRYIEDPTQMYAGDLYTVSASLTGLPALCLPCQTDKQGLPVGMQLTGNAFAERKLYQAAYALEQELHTAWAQSENKAKEHHR